MPETINCSQFGQFLVDQQPKYAEEILRAIRPNDGWIAHVSTGQFPAHHGASMYKDRFEHVFPNTTRPWTQVSYTSCVGQPCAANESLIGWGSSRLQFFLERQQWATPVLCLYEDMLVTHAEEQYRQIISDILRPATLAIQSMFLRKRALYWADNKYVATSGFGTDAAQFNYIWENDADGNEVYLLTDKIPTSKLTPQMLQRLVSPLMIEGYGGKDPYSNKDHPPMIQLVAGMETAWELNHLGGQTGVGGTQPTTIGNWRFTEWEAASKYWRYGFVGSVGDYAVRVDPYELRFNLVTTNSGNATYPYRFQVLLPLKNIVSSGAGGAAGLKSISNPDYQLARYRMSFVWHREAMKMLTLEATGINPEMPYLAQNFAGKWRAVLPQVCVNPATGSVTALDNRRGNLVQFLADHDLAIEPGRTEWAVAIFHMGEPSCIYEVPPCNADPGYPVQTYDSSNEPCPVEE